MRLAKESFYTFLVDNEANKGAVAKAVEDEFGVSVVSVKLMNLKAEKKLQKNRRGYFIVPGVKKALVQVKKGQKIEIFATEVPQEAQEATADLEPKVKEKKSLLKGTKVKVEKGGEKEKKGEK